MLHTSTAHECTIGLHAPHGSLDLTIYVCALHELQHEHARQECKRGQKDLLLACCSLYV